MNFPFFRDFLIYLDGRIPVLNVGPGMIAVSPRIDIRMQLQLNSITTDLLPSKGNITKFIVRFGIFSDLESPRRLVIVTLPVASCTTDV